MNSSIREFPDQPGVDRSKRQCPAVRLFASSRNIVEQPVHFGAGEVGVDYEPRLLLNHFCVSGGSQFVAERRGATILPNDCVMNRFTGFAIPNNGGFALIGDADAGDIFGRGAGATESLGGYTDLT